MPNPNDASLRREVVGGYPQLTSKRGTHVNLRTEDGKELASATSQPDEAARGLIVREAGDGGTPQRDIMDALGLLLVELKAIRAYLSVLTDERIENSDLSD